MWRWSTAMWKRGFLLPKGTPAGRDILKVQVPVTLLPMFVWGEGGQGGGKGWGGVKKYVTLNSGIPSHIGEKQKIACKAPRRKLDSQRKRSSAAVHLSQCPVAARLPWGNKHKWWHTSGVDDFFTIFLICLFFGGKLVCHRSFWGFSFEFIQKNTCIITTNLLSRLFGHKIRILSHLQLLQHPLHFPLATTSPALTSQKRMSPWKNLSHQGVTAAAAAEGRPPYSGGSKLFLYKGQGRQGRQRKLNVDETSYLKSKKMPKIWIAPWRSGDQQLVGNFPTRLHPQEQAMCVCGKGSGGILWWHQQWDSWSGTCSLPGTVAAVVKVLPSSFLSSHFSPSRGPPHHYIGGCSGMAPPVSLATSLKHMLAGDRSQRREEPKEDECLVWNF